MKVWVMGVPGAGKTFLAETLAKTYGIAHYELDRYFWTKDWQIKPTFLFLEQVDKASDAASWVIEGNYVAAAPLLQQRATLLLWVDVPFWISYPRVLYRTLQKIITREAFWEGNRETWQNTLRKDGMPCYALFKHGRNQKRLKQYWDAFNGPKVHLTHYRSVIRDAIQACKEQPTDTYNHHP